MIRLQNKYLTKIIEKNKNISIEINNNKKLAFFCQYDTAAFNIFAPIIKNIKPENIDLVFSAQRESFIKSTYSDYLENFNPIFDIHAITEYEYIMGVYWEVV